MPMNIVVADDNLANRLVLSGMLEDVDCSVIEAGDGAEAVGHFMNRHPALILLDVRMPGMNGIEAARHIRALERDVSAAHIPIVAVTSYDDPKTKVRCKEVGMDGFLRKPVRSDILLSMIKSLLAQSHNPLPKPA
jgi:two-component system, HptB-dependent secretion and biofilm response regulator